MVEDENVEKLKQELKQKFIELSKNLEDPDAIEENEYDLGITFDEKDYLQFEEEQELDEMVDKMIEDLADKLIDLESEGLNQ